MKTKIISTILMGTVLLTQNSIAQKYWQEDFITEKETNIYTEIGTSQDGLFNPVDLDFNSLDSSELWVVNMRNDQIGGSTVTYRDVGGADQKSFHKTDGNSRHFMSLPTALAFGANGDWATSPGVLDANFSNGQRAPYTGPSLWSSDFSIYAKYAGPGTNGSHLDMLHGSPYSMGIAWYKDNAYYIFDGYNRHLAMYDFAADHGPGNSNHDDGRLRRYPEITLKRLGLIPGHMEVDPQRKWLYINDVGNKRIIRVDITSGSVKGASSVQASERLAENVDMENVTWEVVANTGLDKPCGLDVTDDRLIITDNGTNELIVYDLSQSSGFPELGRIKLTGYNNVMGVKLDEEGKIWFVDKTARVVVRIDNENVNKREDDGAFVGTVEISKASINVYPNPVSNLLNISGVEGIRNVVIYDFSGKQVLSQMVQPSATEIDITSLEKGIYILKLSNPNDTSVHVERIVKE